MGARRPAEIHLLAGSYRADRHGPVPSGVPIDAPPPPAHVAEVPEAAAEWTRIATAQAALGMLTAADLGLLEMACLSYSRWRQAEAVIGKLGSTYTVQATHGGGEIARRRPECAVAVEERRLYRQLCADLAIGPVSRGRGSPAKQTRGGSAILGDD